MASPIIIYRLGSLGDTVVALPCFHQIARAFPDRKRIVLTNEPVSGVAPALLSVLGGSGLIDEVITYSVGARSPLTLFRLMLKLRATGAQTMVYLSAGRGSAAVQRDLRFFRLCGMRKIIGAPVTDDLHDNRIDPDGLKVEPEAERLARTLAALGPIDLQDRANWDLSVTDPEQAVAGEALAPLAGSRFFAINIGTKLEINRWGAANWSALLATLAPILKSEGLVGIGAPDDHAPTQALLDQWPGATLNLCGALAPRQSAGVLSKAEFFVGHDSGPMHLSAAMNTPTIGIFGNNNRPGKWHPYGKIHRAVQDMRGIEFVTVEQVRNAVLALADRPPAATPGPALTQELP